MFQPFKVPLLLLAVCIASGCQSQNQPGKTASYVENGVVWAYGTMRLAALDAPGIVVLKRNTADQSLDTTYSLFGTYQSADLAAAHGARKVVYGDLQIEQDRMLAFVYQLDASPRTDGSDLIDVFALLKHAGRSYFKRERVYLGTAQFGADAVLAPVTLGDGLNMSLIAGGSFAGEWALHYSHAPQQTGASWAGLCARNLAQLPGQALNQATVCQTVAAQQDLCDGDPAKDGCRPDSPVQKVPVQPASSLDVLSQQDGVFALPKDATTGKLVFVSQTMKAATEADNAVACAKIFLAVGRTMGREVNAACVLKPAPAMPKDGKLTCAVTVEFAGAETYRDKICNVTGAFRGASLDQQTLQVLKR